MATTETKRSIKTRRYRKVRVSQDRFFYASGVCYHGRLSNGRLGWRLPENRNCIELVKKGFSIEEIARRTKLTKSQIAYRCRKVGVSVMGWRRGESDEAKRVLDRYTVEYD